MCCRRKQKGSVLASFFCFWLTSFFLQAQPSLTKIDITNGATSAHLSADPLWHRLLQLQNREPVNYDYPGYLSRPFTSAAELVATIDMIFDSPQKACAYPARKRFIEDRLKLPHDALDFVVCHEYQQYLKKVPAHQAYLVFAAENVTSASSMMGHIMLRFDGTNEDALPVKHGITFFTELDSLNIPVLLYQTLIQGKEGVFQVAPYAPFQHHYRRKEQRNIWEYQLNLAPHELARLQDMVWELGQFSPSYFFDSYNCATITRLLLAMVSKHTKAPAGRIVTPLDVVRFAEQHNMVVQTQLIPSDKWVLNTLDRQLSVSQQRTMLAGLTSGNWQPATEVTDEYFVANSFASHLNEYLKDTDAIDVKVHQQNKQLIEESLLTFKNHRLNVNIDTTPTNASSEAMLATAIRFQDNDPFVTLRYFPVASQIHDNHYYLTGESELILADIQVRASPQNQQTYLDHLMLYSMTSRPPYHPTWGSLSTGFRSGITRVYDSHLNRPLVLQIEGSLGVTYEYSRALGVYLESAVGFTADTRYQQIYIQPKAGLYAYLAHQLKLNTEINMAFNQYDHKTITRIDTSLTHYINPDYSVRLSAEHLRVSGHHQSNWQLQLRYRF